MFQFHEGKLETDPIKVKWLVSNAQCFAKLFRSVTELNHLRGLDSGEKLDPRDKIRATASLVGLGVPKVMIIFAYTCLSFSLSYPP